MQQIKTNKVNFICFIITFLLFLVTFVEGLEFTLYKNIKDLITILLLCISIYLVLSKNKFNIKRIIKPFLVFCLIFIICILNSSKSLTLTKPIMGGIRFMIILFNSIVIYSYVFNKIGYKKFIKWMLIYFIFFLLINDFFIFVTPNLFEKNYFIGNKFSVVYLHINTFIFFLLNLDEKRNNLHVYYIILLLLIIIGVLSINKTGSGTFIVSIVLFVILLFIPKKILYDPKILVITMFLCAIFPFVYNKVLDNSYVQYFIVNILNKNLNLTGRTVIYDYLPDIINGKKVWFGYGYGSSWEVVYNMIHYPNTQNGMIDFILENGIVGTFGFLYFIISLIRKNIYNSKWLIVLAYIYIIISTFEITYKINFICIFIIMFIVNNSKNDERELKNDE